MKSILITGASGSGKTTICNKLIELGYEAHDIEAIPGLFTLVNKTSRAAIPLSSHNNLDIRHVSQVEWLCNKDKLGEFIATQKKEIAFYCGLGTNIVEALPLFSAIVLLKTSPNTVQERLATRTTSDFGRASDVREWILQRDAVLEREIQKHADFVVRSDSAPAQTAQEIIEKTA